MIKQRQNNQVHQNQTVKKIQEILKIFKSIKKKEIIMKI
jgi:hypothetical protein